MSLWLLFVFCYNRNGKGVVICSLGAILTLLKTSRY